MKKIYYLFCILCLSSLSYSQQWNWAISSTGITTTGYNSASDVVIDSAKNVYVVGNFDAPLIFGSFVLFPNNVGVFVAKFDSTGICLWAKKADAYTSYAGPSIALDSNQDLVITGMYYYSAGFDTITLNSNGQSDIFIAKITTNGVWKWAKSYGGSSYDQGRQIAVDVNNNIYVTGTSVGNVNFDTLQVNGLGGYDAFLGKFSPTGKCLWVKNSIGSGNEKGTCITVSSSGSLYMGGVYSGSPNVFGTPFNTIAQTDEFDFLSKLDLNGNPIWNKQLSCGAMNNLSGLSSIDTDNNDNIYITGNYAYSCLLDTYSFPPPVGAARNAYIAKLNPSGNVLWAKKGNGPSNCLGISVYVNSNKYCFVSGFYTDSLNFGDCSSFNPGGNGYIITLDSLGHCLCISNTPKVQSSIITGNSSALWITGFFTNSTSFGAQSVTTGNHTEVFIANAKISCPLATALNDIGMKDEGLNVYPNPFINKFTITSTVLNKTNIEIYNSLGLLIYCKEQTNKNMEIGFDNELPGIYFIKIGSTTKKVIKE